MERPKKETVATNIRFPSDLRKKAEELAEKDNRKLSNWLIKLVKEAIEKSR